MRGIILNRKISGHQRNRKLVPYEQSKQFGLLINTTETNLNSIKKMEQELRNLGKAVECIYLNPTKRPKEEAINKTGNQFKEHQFYKNDIGISGLPKSDLLKHWLKDKYDYLIACNPNNSIFNKAVLGLCSAYCIVGCAPLSSELIDLFIENTNQDQYLDSVINTLKQIK